MVQIQSEVLQYVYMTLEEEIRSILFEVGKELVLHQIEPGKFIIEIDYEKYAKQIINVINNK